MCHLTDFEIIHELSNIGLVKYNWSNSHVQKQKTKREPELNKAPFIHGTIFYILRSKNNDFYTFSNGQCSYGDTRI